MRDPAATLQSLIAFLGVPWDDCVLDPMIEEANEPQGTFATQGEIFKTSIGRWRRELTHHDCTALRLLISPVLAELGYEKRLHWSTHSEPAPSLSME